MRFVDPKKLDTIIGYMLSSWLPKVLPAPRLPLCWAMPLERWIHYWIHRFEAEGFAGLADADRSGRPKKLSEQQLDEIGKALRESPRKTGLTTNIWDGKTLSIFIRQQYAVDLGVRQCQRLFRQLGFRLRKPRPIIAKADIEQQKKHKKNSEK